MKLEHMYQMPPPHKVLALSSRRMRICRVLAHPLAEERCGPLIECIEEHLRQWRDEVDAMRTEPQVLKHKKHALFAWKITGDELGSTCPHFDTLCFEHTLALLHLQLGNWEEAQKKAAECCNVLQKWSEATLVGHPQHVILFPDFHNAVAAYAKAQCALDSLNVELSTFPRVPFRACATTCIVALRGLQSSMALNTPWELALNHSMASLATLARGLIALDTLEYDHADAQSMELSRSGRWKEDQIPTALAILQLAKRSEGNITLPNICRSIHSNIRAFVEGLNRDVYHTKAHPNFLKVFEEAIVPCYTGGVS